MEMHPTFLIRSTARRAFALCLTFAFITAFAPAVQASDGWSDVDETYSDIREMAFPVAGPVNYVDTWLFPRGSGRRHIGVDMMADKLTPLVAVNNACVTYLDWGGPGGGNMLTLTDADGWQYRYLHMNNDTPGTDDGANPYEWAFANNLQEGDCVERGQVISYAGDSGNAEFSGSHLHFEVRRPDGLWINPFIQVSAAETAGPVEPGAPSEPTQPSEHAHPSEPTQPSDPTAPAEMPAPGVCLSEERSAPIGAPSEDSARGYWLLDSDGTVHAYDAPHFGDFATEHVHATPVSMTATASGDGYWILDTAGKVYPFGDAEFFGDMSDIELNGPVRRLEPEPAGNGYWLVADDGGVFAFGEAKFLGSTGALELESPIISMTANAEGDGYWLVGGDGGVFAFGAAEFRGSTGALALDSPIIDMAVSPDGRGYWLYAGDGGVFSFGVEFYGSAPGLGRCSLAPSVALRVSNTGGGYWIATENGEVLEFGDAAHRGDSPELASGAKIVDMAIHHRSDPV